MSNLQLKLAKEETKRQYIAAVDKIANEFLHAGGMVTRQLIASPIFQMLIFCVAVEAAQRTRYKGQPLLSDFLGNTLETVVITGKTLETVAGSLDNFISPLTALGEGLGPLLGKGS